MSGTTRVVRGARGPIVRRVTTNRVVRAESRRAACAVVFAASACLAAPSCGGNDAPAQAPAAAQTVRPYFREITASTGITFVHENGASPARRMLETMGGGVAVLDYDGDGRPDLYFVDSGNVPEHIGERAPGSSRLYKNLGGWKFEDVTARAGVSGRGYMMGAIAGDYDSDNDQDIYVTSYGSNILFQNQGDGTFRDVTKTAGADDERWSTGAAFVDVNGDGKLDLFVQNYIAYRVEADHPHFMGTTPIYPSPDLFDPTPCVLLQNRGDGTFEDVSVASGVASVVGKGLGVLTNDLDGDGDVDIYCSNDTMPNTLFENLGGGRVREVGMLSGAAYGEDGRERSGMGVDAADFDGDGRFDLVVTNYQNEPNSIYRNDGGLLFTEITSRTGTMIGSLRSLGFGVRWLELDNDGYADLVVANGHVLDNAPLVDPTATYRQAPLLYRGTASGRFEDIAEQQSSAFRTPRAGRGLASADLDGDGDLDLVLASVGGAAAIFENAGGNERAWLRVKAVGTRCDSTALGARVEVTAGGRTHVQEVHSGGSYLSQSELVLHFGLGDATRVEKVRVRWPGGAVEEARDLAARATVTFVEGSGLVTN